MEMNKIFSGSLVRTDISEYKTKQLYGYALKNYKLAEADTELKNNTWIQVDISQSFKCFLTTQLSLSLKC